MPVLEFLDSNVLVYAYDPADQRKQHASRDLVRRAIAGEILISTQVLSEFCAVLLHKMSPPAAAKDAVG